jgi:hypothetical protein
LIDSKSAVGLQAKRRLCGHYAREVQQVPHGGGLERFKDANDESAIVNAYDTF